jgi:HPt (histidine-containing phosphotransfer) domain-containing protein
MNTPVSHDSALLQSVDLLRALEVGSDPGPEVAGRLRELVGVVQWAVQEGHLCVSSGDVAHWPAVTESMSTEELRVLAEILDSLTVVESAEPPSMALAVPSALQRFEGDSALLGEVLEVFLEMVPMQIKQMHEADAAGNWDRVAEIAHELRGAAANVGAEALRAVACEVELDLRGNEPRSMAKELGALEHELARLRLAVQAFRAGGSGS